MDLRVIEVGRVNRQLRHRHGKTDTIDAESAARAILAGEAMGEPRFAHGAVVSRPVGFGASGAE
jgi:transposase